MANLRQRFTSRRFSASLQAWQRYLYIAAGLYIALFLFLAYMQVIQLLTLLCLLAPPCFVVLPCLFKIDFELFKKTKLSLFPARNPTQKRRILFWETCRHLIVWLVFCLAWVASLLFALLHVIKIPLIAFSVLAVLLVLKTVCVDLRCDCIYVERCADYARQLSQNDPLLREGKSLFRLLCAWRVMLGVGGIVIATLFAMTALQFLSFSLAFMLSASVCAVLCFFGLFYFRHKEAVITFSMLYKPLPAYEFPALPSGCQRVLDYCFLGHPMMVSDMPDHPIELTSLSN